MSDIKKKRDIRMTKNTQSSIRHNWKSEEILILLDLPFNDLIYKAQQTHRAFHDPNKVQISTLLSIKTGACPEDCAYCPQSVHYKTSVDVERLLPVDDVVKAASTAKESGANRFCMGAAWRSPSDKNLEVVIDMIKKVAKLGMETCVTLGMLTAEQARRLSDAGLDYYNHNLDTSPEFYGSVITTRTYQERLDTLEHVRQAGIKVCCGGILGMGESRQERAGLLVQLANMPDHPESVPINMLIQVEGTPLYGIDSLDSFEFVRTIAAARILMPYSWVRLSAGRENMSDETQALCFLAGANSIFYGDMLLTTSNPAMECDRELFERLGLQTLDDGPTASQTTS